MSRRGWVLLTLLTITPSASAWNNTGHMIAALIAYDRMPPTVRGTMAKLVHSHPRFNEDFAPRLPKGLRHADAAQQDRWYFAFASVWPDVARRFDNVRGAGTRDALIALYNHSTWHYINLPTYLQSSDRRRFDAPAPSMSAYAGLDDAQMNIVQALEVLTGNWCGGGDADRALALSWITHLIADVHQPLHATTLFAFPAFVRGDRGGNDIQVTGDIDMHADNLHALWDGALGDESKVRELDALARDYDRLVAGVQQKDDRGDLSRNFQTWAKHSRALAATDAYTADVRAAVAAAGTTRPSVQIGAAYRSAMHASAVRQISLAGRRTASVLVTLANTLGTTGCARRAN